MKRAVVIVVVLTLAFSGYWFFGRAKSASAGTQYLTSTVARGNVTASIAATGTVESALTYGLSFGQTTVTAASGTSSTSGSSSGANSSNNSNSNASTTNLVTEIHVSVGQHVAAGTVLAQEDGTGSAAAVAAAAASVQVAQAQVSNAQSQLQSTQLKIASQSSTAADIAGAKAQLAVDQAQLAADTALLSADTTTLTTDLAAKPAKTTSVIAHDRLVVAKDQQSIVRDNAAIASDQIAITSAANPSAVQAANAASLAQAQAAVTQAQNAVVTANANLKAAQTTAAATTIKAPASGVITAVNLTVGNAPGSGAGIVLHSDNLAVVASVAEQDEPNLTAGLTANVTITSLNQTVTAKLQDLPTAASSSSAGSGAVSFPVTFILDNNPAGLLPGMSASISVTTATANNVIEVPTSAIQGTSPNYTVQVMVNGKPESTPVNVGLTTNSLTEIISGLSVGQVVVTGTVSQTLTTTTTGGGLGGGTGRTFGGGTRTGGGGGLGG